MRAVKLELLYLLLLLSATVAAADWLATRTVLRHAGTALLAIMLGAVASNLGLIPTGTDSNNPVVLYEFIFAFLAPLSIFWLLLRANLSHILKAGLPMLGLFAVGSMGTVLGALIALAAFDGAGLFSQWNTAIAGALVGTYTGGSLNFNAIALHYDLVREGILYGGIIAADNIITAVWMAATLAAPRLLAPLWVGSGPDAGARASVPSAAIRATPEVTDSERMSAGSISLVLLLGAAALWLTDVILHYLQLQGIAVPGILILSLIALLLAQVPAINRLPGTQVVGVTAVYFFLAVIGAHCDLAALQALGTTGLLILALTSAIVLFHGFTIFSVARLLRMDLTGAAIASQANIGGGATALAIAKAQNRPDLAAPAVLIGTLGTASGTFIGFFAAETLLPLFL